MTPTTPEQAALLEEIGDLHALIRDLNVELAALRAADASPEVITAKVAELVAGIRRVIDRYGSL